MTSWDLGGEGNSFSFDNIGDHIAGTVLDLTERQQTDMDTGQPAVWDNGDKKMMSIVTLQTEIRDPANPADDGKRTVALTGSKKAESKSRMGAVLAAVKAATGSTSLQYGGRLIIQYTGDGQASRKGFNPPKQYQAWYEAPAMELHQPTQQAAPPAQQPPPTAPGPGGLGQFAPQQAPPQQAQHQGPPPAGPGGPGSAWPPPQGPAPGWAQQPPAQPPAPAGPVNTATGQVTVQPGQPTPEQVAGLQALGIDPVTVYPNWRPAS